MIVPETVLATYVQPFLVLAIRKKDGIFGGPEIKSLFKGHNL